MISFTVPSIPIAQPRQRQRVVTTAGRTFAQNYTPTKDPVNAFKAAVQHSLRDAYQGPPLEGAIRLGITFRLPRPKTKTWKTKPMPSYLHTGKPDLDNLAKSVKDALSGLAYRDDAQIARLVCDKWVCGGWQSPCVEITIDALDEENSNGNQV